MPSRLFCTSSLIAIAITLGGCGGDTARGTAQEANLGGSPSGDGAGGTGEAGGGGSNAGGSSRTADAGGAAGVTGASGGASGGTAGAPGSQSCPFAAGGSGECNYGASCTDGRLTCICSGLPMPDQPGPTWMCTLLPEGCPLEPATDQTPCGDESLNCQYMHLMVSCSCSSGTWYCGEFDF